VRVLDIDERRYALALARHSDRDEVALSARNQALAEVAEKVMRASRPDVPDFYLPPCLIAHHAYRDPLPPDPWDGVLRADLRFVVGKDSVNLTEKVVDELEREPAV
jgi:hypothetical protein